MKQNTTNQYIEIRVCRFILLSPGTWQPIHDDDDDLKTQALYQMGSRLKWLAG